MKRIFTCLRVTMVLCLIQSIVYSTGYAQSFTARANVAVDPGCNGFWEYLPAGYNTNQKYPLIIAMHGLGEDGNGSLTALNVLTGTGLPYIIKSGKFPSSTTVNGVTYQFVVIAPQFTTNPTMATMDAVYAYCIQHYSVDLNRVYMTGYSQGGGGAAYYVGYGSSYANKIAAVLPIATAVTLDPSFTQTIASANLPMLATDNSGDGWYTSNTITNVANINSSTPAPNPRAQYYLFNANGHGGWNETYDPTIFTFNGLTAYQWMLQFQRNATAALPIVLGAYTAALTGPSAITVNWTTVSEINNKYFILEHSSDGIAFSPIDTTAAANHANGYTYSYTDTHPAAGNNFYRLVQVDLDGKTTYFDVLKVVVATTLQSGLRISPNPAGSMVQLQLSHPETGDVQVILSDMQGRTLRSWKFNKTVTAWQQTLQLGNIAPGVYTLQVRGTTIHETQQFVEQ